MYIYDREPLETVTGVDLLIHNRAFNSYLLLQYKMMKRAESGEWSYQVDEQLMKQLEAMRRFELGAHAGRRPPALVIDWRMNPTGCYVKFCEEPSGRLRDDRLVPGLTLSAEHLDHFLALPDSEGMRGGRRVGYTNCQRYLNNTLFIDLAHNGWIGCDRAGFELLNNVITAGQKHGRMAMLAVVDSANTRRDP